VNPSTILKLCIFSGCLIVLSISVSILNLIKFVEESNTHIACEYFFGNVPEVAQDVAACEIELRDVIKNYGKQPTPYVFIQESK
jgi:hypothetical protein